MLTGRRYLLAFTSEQEQLAETIGEICRVVWNTGLEQRRAYRRQGTVIGYVEQARQLAEAKKDFPWLAETPSHTLQQTLRDLERACKTHGAFQVRWRSKKRGKVSFRFPDPNHLQVKRLNRRWGAVKLPKFGWVRFRWTRPLGGTVRNATVPRDGGRWYIAFCVEDGLPEAAPNGQPPVGVDRGVVNAVTCSDGWAKDRELVTPGEAKRLRRLQQQLARQKKGSKRRAVTKAKLARLNARIRNRRNDFCVWVANRLTRRHGLVVVEDLNIKDMTASAKGTIEAPGRQVRQKAGLNRAILNKGWSRLVLALEHAGRYHGCSVVMVNPAYTSQTCSAWGHRASENRESQAVFRCVACGHLDHADVNAAKNILAAGLAVTGRGDLAGRRL
ncbi:transposase [Carbonactinospora thermoautotrophica]|uniref:RNA-guided endonuclease InsQ/TnpB family protein n=1 Tax=Carbonactinospora thermoautotrophica TaxID=1469144 RepID=UPI00227131F3|nr:transposase [Carbonactinospora thermoautotrophica]MCX9190684.1 transposase [Carbonactinospora thermoautotrophica]